MTEKGRCPHCGGEIDELTVICRHCKKNVRKATSRRPGARVPLWAPPVVLVLVVLVILWSGRSGSSKATPTVVPGLRGAVEAALGEGNREVERVSRFSDSSSATGQVYVKFAINDNFSQDMILKSAQMDCTEILKAIAMADTRYGSARIVGTFPLKDALGNVKETEVVRLEFEAGTVQKINWSGFSYKNIYTIADSADIHLQFRP